MIQMKKGEQKESIHHFNLFSFPRWFFPGGSFQVVLSRWIFPRWFFPGESFQGGSFQVDLSRWIIPGGSFQMDLSRWFFPRWMRGERERVERRLCPRNWFRLPASPSPEKEEIGNPLGETEIPGQKCRNTEILGQKYRNTRVEIQKY